MVLYKMCPSVLPAYRHIKLLISYLLYLFTLVRTVHYTFEMRTLPRAACSGLACLVHSAVGDIEGYCHAACLTHGTVDVSIQSMASQRILLCAACLAHIAVGVPTQPMAFEVTAVQLAWLAALSTCSHTADEIRGHCCAACLAHDAVDCSHG